MADTTLHPIRATGRRKTSVAQVRLSPGGGKVSVNERAVEGYFTIAAVRSAALMPLQATQRSDKYDVTVDVSGGGNSGQAGAVRQALARALLKAEPELKPLLRQQGFLTRDSRMKERKKYGQPGARKRFQFSKR